MLAEMVDHVIGIDPDRNRVTAAVIDSRTHAELAGASFPTTPAGYASLIEWADEASSTEARVWSIEGAGSYGAGLCSTLQATGEWVVEFDHPSTRPARDGAKTDGLDAIRAGRELLGRPRLTAPRARGTREAIRALMVARRGARTARVAALNTLKALVVTAPVQLREQLRVHSAKTLVDACRRLQLTTGLDDETIGTKAMPKPYPREFREDVIRVARNRDPDVMLKTVAADFGISESCLNNWLRTADVEGGIKPGTTAADNAELKAAKRRIRLLEQENEVLRRAAAYLSQANLPGK